MGRLGAPSLVYALLFLLFLFPLHLGMLFAAEAWRVPDPAATVDGAPISREMVLNRLRRESGDRVLTPEAYRAAAAAAIRQEVYFHLLGRLLETEQIAPSALAVALYLDSLQQLLPRGLPQRSEADRQSLIAEEAMQWNVAVLEFLRKTAPEFIAATELEIEQAYRFDPNAFRLPERYEFGVIGFPADAAGREAASVARDRLRQGEDFDRLAAEVCPDGVELSEAEFIELLKAGDTTLPLHAVSPVLENSRGCYLIKIKSKRPGELVPLAEAAPYLRLQIEAAKAARALELLLRRELDRAEVKMFTQP